jgi:hypothetical protein
MTGLTLHDQARDGTAGAGTPRRGRHVQSVAPPLLPVPHAARDGAAPLRSDVRIAPERVLATQRLVGNAATVQLVRTLRGAAQAEREPTGAVDRPRVPAAPRRTSPAQAAPSPAIQRFTAELGDDERVYLRPERGDTDRDLDATLCAAAKDRKIGGRDRIDVTSCLPPRAVAAMGLGPYNCAEYVRLALSQKPGASGKDLSWFDTPQLWDELRGKGMTVTSLRVLQEDGKVVPAKGLSWSQLSPRTGDIVFMNGEIRTRGGQEPRQSGDNFSVTWDHVGIFIVRSRAGRDYHLAKDGDENTTGLYQTGSAPEMFSAPGAYVRGVESLAAYLGTGGSGTPSRRQEQTIYVPGEQSKRFWALSQEERDRVVAEVDVRFVAETGVTRALRWESEEDRPLARQWLELRDRIMSERPATPEGADR